MDKFIVTRQNTVIDEFHPDSIKCVCFNAKDARAVCAFFNKGHEKTKKAPAERSKLNYIIKKLEKYTAILKEHDLLPKPGRKKQTPGEKQPPKSKQPLQKTCPGVVDRNGNVIVAPHHYIANSGAQKMCRSCRERKRIEEASDKKKGLRGCTTYWKNNVVPTPDQVLEMTDPVARENALAKFSPAELKQYNILKNKREMEKMRRLRNKSFGYDDPIMGCGISNKS